MRRTSLALDITASATMSSSRATAAIDFSLDPPTLNMTDVPSMPRSLEDLPDEVLSHILFHLAPEETLLSVQLVSRRIYSLVQEPLLWRHHCRAWFHYWDEKHDIRRRFKADIGKTDWLELFLERRHADAATTRLLNSILSEQIGRIDKTNRISEFGYDAKDTLLRHGKTDYDAPDVLARRYHSNAVLDHIQRGEALKVWHGLSIEQAGRHSGRSTNLERALGGFDMFILHEHFGDMDEISELLDRLKEDVLNAYPDFRHFSPRQKALTAAQYLRNNNLTGLEDEGRYRDFQNNYIGAALQDPKHPSIPLISVAIYCAVARRLGLNASFVNYPAHVYAMVRVENEEQIYLDPWRSAEDVPRSKLVAWMAEGDIPPDAQDIFLSPATISSMVHRSSNNLLHSCQLAAIEDDDWLVVRAKKLSHPTHDANDAVYSAMWAVYMMSRFPNRARLAIPQIRGAFERNYPEDGIFIEEYICKRPDYLDEEEIDVIRDTIRVTRTSDYVPKAMKRRDGSVKGTFPYRIGQVIMHKRERYIGVICGWDEQCMSDHRSSTRQRWQSFYYALVHDSTLRYLMEESIEILEPDEAPEALLPVAGKYFKRWDKETKRFVSNITDEYPDN